MKRSHFLILLALALALGTASFFVHQSDYPLTYDEGDYWVAVGNGFWTNWTDADDISILEFARMGYGAVRDPESRARLSDYIRSAGSTMFYRHYHPPLAFYPAIVLKPFTQDLPLHWQLRLANLFWLVVWIAALALLGWRYPELRSPAYLLLPASAAWAMAVVGFNMHLPFGMLLSLFLLCWHLHETTGQTGPKRAAQFFLAAGFATVEYGMFVLAFILLWGVIAFWRSTEKRRFLRAALASAGWVALFLLLLWPAGVLGLNLLKSWTFVIYVALFRLGGEPVAFGGWWTLILEKWNANPGELLLLVLFLGFTLWRWRELLRRGSLFAAAGFILALLYLQINPTLVYRWYLFPAFAVGFGFLGHVWLVEWGLSYRSQRLADNAGNKGIVDRMPGDKTLSIAVSAVGLFLIAWNVVPEPDYSELKGIHRLLDETEPDALVIPRSLLPQLQPYLPDAHISSHHDVAFPDMALADSVARWRQHSLVITPAGADNDTLAADGTIGGYRYFLPR